ncbi:MAG TPA: hypothetical protein PLW86_06455, partial [Rhodocyclaceae bacterium]|nr:hypothetical protein [Rhodocyclaceae bacterium]
MEKSERICKRAVYLVGLSFLVIGATANAGSTTTEALPKTVTKIESRDKSEAASDAKVALGLAFLKKGGNHDLQEAYRLFAEAAKVGNPDAEFNLGVLHMTGRGVS